MWDLIVSVPDHCLSFYFTVQSESKNTKKGLTVTGALIFCCTLLVNTCCQNNAIESH